MKPELREEIETLAELLSKAPVVKFDLSYPGDRKIIADLIIYAGYHKQRQQNNSLEEKEVYLTLFNTYPEGSDVLRTKYAKAICQHFTKPARGMSVADIIWQIKDVLSSKYDVDALTFDCNINYSDLKKIAQAIHAAIEEMEA